MRIKRDYGLNDYFKYYTKNSTKKVDKLKYNKIISEFNKSIVDLMINEGIEFTPTKLQFTFCIRKIKKTPTIKDGKLINTSPIDWKSTNELWENNPVAKEKKILLRFLNTHTFKHVFRIKAFKQGLIYANKKLYKFKPARSFQRLLAKRILDPNQVNFDAYKLY